jgi:hypothetical protein
LTNSSDATILGSNINSGGGQQNNGNVQRRTSVDSQAVSVGKTFWSAIVILKKSIAEKGKLQMGAKKTFDMACEAALNVLKAVPVSETKNVVTESLKEQLQNIDDDLKKYAAADVVSGGRDDRLSQQYGKGSNTVNNNQGSNDDGSQNEKFVAEMSLRRLTNVEQRCDGIFLELRKDQEQMMQLNARLATLDFRKVNYQQLLDLMAEALDLTGKIKRQWDQLSNFSQAIATHISGSLNNTMTDFVQPAFELTNLGTDITREDGLDALEDMRFNAGIVKDHGKLLHFLSKSYVDVSRAYLTKPLAGLASLFAA